MPRHECRGNRQLGGGQAESFACELFAHTFHFVQHLAGLNFCDPEFGIAFTVTHTNFGRLLRNGLVRKNANPDTAATLDVTVDRTTGGFDLASGKPAAAGGLEAELAKRNLRTAGSQTSVAALVLLAVLSA